MDHETLGVAYALNQRAQMWWIAYCSVHSFQFHPGCKSPLSAAESARVADDMFHELLKREASWRG